MLNNFRAFENEIFEEERNEAVDLASQIFLTFFDVYSQFLIISPGYDKIVNDLQSLTKGDAQDKGKTMVDIISSVSLKVSPEYRNVESELFSVVDIIINAYENLLEQFDGNEGEIKQIKDEAVRVSLDFLDKLKSSKKQIKEGFSLDPDLPDYLTPIFEAVKHKRQRKDLIDKIVATKGFIDTKINTSGLKPLQSKLKSLSNELEEMSKILDLDNSEYWDGKKRKDGISELDKMASRIIEIPGDLAREEEKMLRKFASNKEAVDLLNKAKKQLEEVRAKVDQEVSKKVTSSEKKDSESSSEDKNSKSQDYQNIDSNDPDNMRKSGKNRERIRSYQKKVNDLLSKSEGYSKIDEDGLYGNNTKNAFSKLQKLANILGAGLNTKGELTKGTQIAIDNLIKNSDKIVKFLKKQE